MLNVQNIILWKFPENEESSAQMTKYICSPSYVLLKYQKIQQCFSFFLKTLNLEPLLLGLPDKLQKKSLKVMGENFSA